MSRPRAEMIPAFTEPPKPNGFPTASTQSPTRARVESPLGATAGVWCLTIATIVYFSVQGYNLFLHAVLIALFVALTAPVTTIFLMRAALFRERMSGRNTVPPSVSAPHGTQNSDKNKGKP